MDDTEFSITLTADATALTSTLDISTARMASFSEAAGYMVDNLDAAGNGFSVAGGKATEFSTKLAKAQVSCSSVSSKLEAVVKPAKNSSSALRDISGVLSEISKSSGIPALGALSKVVGSFASGNPVLGVVSAMVQLVNLLKDYQEEQRKIQLQTAKGHAGAQAQWDAMQVQELVKEAEQYQSFEEAFDALGKLRPYTATSNLARVQAQRLMARLKDFYPEGEYSLGMDENGNVTGYEQTGLWVREQRLQKETASIRRQAEIQEELAELRALRREYDQLNQRAYAHFLHPSVGDKIISILSLGAAMDDRYEGNFSPEELVAKFQLEDKFGQYGDFDTYYRQRESQLLLDYGAEEDERQKWNSVHSYDDTALDTFARLLDDIRGFMPMYNDFRRLMEGSSSSRPELLKEFQRLFGESNFDFRNIPDVSVDAFKGASPEGKMSIISNLQAFFDALNLIKPAYDKVVQSEEANSESVYRSKQQKVDDLLREADAMRGRGVAEPDVRDFLKEGYEQIGSPDNVNPHIRHRRGNPLGNAPGGLEQPLHFGLPGRGDLYLPEPALSSGVGDPRVLDTLLDIKKNTENVFTVREGR